MELIIIIIIYMNVLRGSKRIKIVLIMSTPNIE